MKNKKTPENPLDSAIVPTVRIGTESKPNKKEDKVIGIIGMSVTLNQKKETMFRIGAFSLNDQDYTSKIPEGMTYAEYDIIYAAIQDGTLVKGNHLIPPVDKDPGVPEEYWTALKNSVNFDRNPEVKKKLHNVFRRGSDRNWSAAEILSYCLAKEKSVKKRKDVILLLEELINGFTGPLTIYTPPPKKTDVERIVIEDGQIKKYLADGTLVQDEVTANKKEVPKLTPETSKILNNMFK